jgi:hypothetical protein
VDFGLAKLMPAAYATDLSAMACVTQSERRSHEPRRAHRRTFRREIQPLAFSPDGNYLYFPEAADKTRLNHNLYRAPVLNGQTDRKFLFHMSQCKTLPLERSALIRLVRDWGRGQ